MSGCCGRPPTAAPDGAEADERTDLTDDQKAAIRLIAQALPPYWRRRIEELSGEDGGPAAVPA